MTSGKLRWMRALVNYQAGWFCIHPWKDFQHLCVGLVVDCTLSRQALITPDSKLFRWVYVSIYAKNAFMIDFMYIFLYLLVQIPLGESPEIKNIWNSATSLIDAKIGQILGFITAREAWGGDSCPGHITYLVQLKSRIGGWLSRFIWLIISFIACDPIIVFTFNIIFNINDPAWLPVWSISPSRARPLSPICPISTWSSCWALFEPHILPLLNTEEVVSSFRAPTPSPSQAQEAFGRPHPPPPSADSVTAETKILHLYRNSSARRAKHQQCRAQND